VVKKKKSKFRDNAIVRYLRETRVELSKVHWPTRQEAGNLTKVVMTVTIFMAFFLGLLDYLFDKELQGIIEVNAIAMVILIVVVVGVVLVVALLKRQRV